MAAIEVLDESAHVDSAGAMPLHAQHAEILEAHGGQVTQTHRQSLWRREVTYPDRSLRLEIRPMTPDDDRRELDFISAQTVRERFLRFMGPRRELEPQEVRRLTHLDFGLDFAVVAVDRATDGLCAIARYMRNKDNHEEAEVAVAVLKRYQRLGLARYLVTLLFEAAKSNGIRQLIAQILRENIASRRLFASVGQSVGAKTRLASVEYDVFMYHYALPVCELSKDALPPAGSKAYPMRCRPESKVLFTVDDSRHPKSLWRHDLHFAATSMRVEVRPADPDDSHRVARFTEELRQSSEKVTVWEALALDGIRIVDFSAGFAFVAIDMASDELVAIANFQRSAESSWGYVLTAPSHRGLGIADFLSKELSKAVKSEVYDAPRRRSAL